MWEAWHEGQSTRPPHYNHCSSHWATQWKQGRHRSLPASGLSGSHSAPCGTVSLTQSGLTWAHHHLKNRQNSTTSLYLIVSSWWQKARRRLSALQRQRTAPRAFDPSPHKVCHGRASMEQQLEFYQKLMPGHCARREPRAMAGELEWAWGAEPMLLDAFVLRGKIQQTQAFCRPDSHLKHVSKSDKHMSRYFP